MKRSLLSILVALSVLCVLPATIFAALCTDLNGVIAYPNPARIAAGNDQVTFENLTANVTIKIFKINGSLVREIDANDTNGKAVWDLTNDSGEKVGSAVYLYLITNSDGQRHKGKIAIIR